MTNYYPHPKRKSLFENCILNAFKDEWTKQETEIKTQINEGSVQTEKAPMAYEAFSLSQSNQTYNIQDSDLFTSSSLLFKNMIDIDREHFRLVDANSSRKQYRPSGVEFRDSEFDVVQIDGPMSYIECIKFLHNLYIDSPELIYGALLHDGRNFINPLHPVIAQSVVKSMSAENPSLDDNKYRIVLYTYRTPTSDKRVERNNFLYTKDFDDLFTNQILQVLAMLDTQSEKCIKIHRYSPLSSMYINVRTFDEPYYFSKLQYEYTAENHSGKRETHLQPVQLINNGIASPYYGIVAQKYVPGSGTHGYNLSPMLSCNLGKCYTNIMEDGSGSIIGANVCTGNFSNESTNGKLSLNHANLGSPYYTDICTSGSYRFADISVRVSIGIYAEFLNLQRIDFLPPTKPKPPVSFEEYKRMHPNASLKEYISGIKNI